MKGTRGTKHPAGSDVPVQETAICSVDENGHLCGKTKVIGQPEGLSKALAETGPRLKRIGPAAGQFSQWLFQGMARAGCPVICVRTRHAKGPEGARHRSESKDGRGIARMRRVNPDRRPHASTPPQAASVAVIGVAAARPARYRPSRQARGGRAQGSRPLRSRPCPGRRRHRPRDKIND
jgi:hypothetical protein